MLADTALKHLKAHAWWRSNRGKFGRQGFPIYDNDAG